LKFGTRDLNTVLFGIYGFCENGAAGKVTLFLRAQLELQLGVYLEHVRYFKNKELQGRLCTTSQSC